MATIATANSTANGSWTLLRTASGDETWSLGFEGVPVELATTTTSTAPADSLFGHRVLAQGVQVTLENNDRLWARRARNVTIGADPQIVLTGGDA